MAAAPASRGNITPRADQPKVSTESLNRSAAGPTLQYRVQSVKSYGSRTPRRTDRSTRG